jgi:hypothetical protein
LRWVQKVASATATSGLKQMQHSHISAKTGATFGGGGGEIDLNDVG